MKRYVLVAGLLLQAALAFGDAVDFSAELAKKIQLSAARRVAAAQGIKLPASEKEPVRMVSAQEPGVKPAVKLDASARVKVDVDRQQRSLLQRLFDYLWGTVSAPFVNTAAFQSLKATVDKGKSRMGDNYYSLYFSVPRETILKYFFLKQLQSYFKKQNDPNGIILGSLMAYLAQTVGRRLRVELSFENVFEAKENNPVLRRLRVFGPSVRFNDQGWARLEPYVKAKTLEDLALFLNQYVDKSGYDENILVQLFVPKNRANEFVKAKMFGKEIALDDLMETDDGFDKNAYGLLTLQDDLNYDDLKTFIVHSLKNSFRSTSDLQKQFAPMVEKVGAEMLASLNNPPAPLPRDTDASGVPLASSVQPSKHVESPVISPQASKPDVPLSFLEQIRQGKELKKTENSAKQASSDENAQVRALAEALERAGALGASDSEADDEGDDMDIDDWDMNYEKPEQLAVSSQPQPLRPQPQVSQKDSPAVTAPTPIKPEVASGASRLQSDLQELLGSKLQKRRGSLEKDTDDMDVEDWD